MKRLWKTALILLLSLALALAIPVWAVHDLPEGDSFIYAQLSPKAQEAYDHLAQHLADYRSGTPITMNFSGTYAPAMIETEARACMDAVNEAHAALMLIHPEIFWLSGNLTAINGYSIEGGRYVLPVTLTPQLRPQWNGGGRSVEADVAAMNAAVQAVADEAILQGSPYLELRYIHDWLTARNVYNTAAAAAGMNAPDYLPWTPLSALTDESQPVCDGYARAFKLLCDELGYPCLCVAGTANGISHAWNIVQVGGQWYAVDVTYDDPIIYGVTDVVSGQENTAHFMIGAKTVVNGAAFSASHIPNGTLVGRFAFSYPALSDGDMDPSFSYAPPDLPGEPEPIRFADVDENTYYAAAVDWAVGVGVTNGTKLNDENGKSWFSPDDTVTRGQAVTFLWRAMGEPAPETEKNSFADVVPGSYYEKAVLWAVENGITNGYGDGRFGPGDTVTRGQMLVFLWRTMGRPGETAPYDGKPWYADAERWGDDSGCVYGTDAAYSTGAQCPRKDVVFYLWNAILWKLSVSD